MPEAVRAGRELVHDGGVDVGVVAAVLAHGGGEGRAQHLGQVLAVDHGLHLGAHDLARLLEEPVPAPVRVEPLQRRRQPVVLLGEQQVEGGQAQEQVHARVAGHEHRLAVLPVPALRLVEGQRALPVEGLRLQEARVAVPELVQVLQRGAVDGRAEKENRCKGRSFASQD